MTDLFPREPAAPLAEALRPRTLDEVIGQSHLLGPGKPLRLAFQSGKPHSMIFWGPPGVGKTTLARLTATAFDCAFIALSAVFSGMQAKYQSYVDGLPADFAGGELNGLTVEGAGSGFAS